MNSDSRISAYSWRVTVTWGTEASTSDPTGSSTRPPIALNRVRVYDPLLSGFLEPDPSDLWRRIPEGYVAFRNNAISYIDRTGASSKPFSDYLLGLSLGGFEFDGNCNGVQQTAVITALGAAYRKLSDCRDGICGQATLRRNIMHDLSRARFFCNSSSWKRLENGRLVSRYPDPEDLLREGWASTVVEWHTDWRLRFDPVKGVMYPPHYDLLRETVFALTPEYFESGETCLTQTVVHEAAHGILRRVPAWAIEGMPLTADFGIFEFPVGGLSAADRIKQKRGRNAKLWEEVQVTKAVGACNLCD